MSPRELRLLRELVINDRVSVKDLRERIGALNPAQVKLMLVRRGWDVQTAFDAVFDRDGKLCHPGYYWMAISERERAREFLESTNRAAGPALLADGCLEYSSPKSAKEDNIKGGGK